MVAGQGEGRRWSARRSGVLLVLPMAGSGHPAQVCRSTVGLTVKNMVMGSPETWRGLWKTRNGLYLLGTSLLWFVIVETV